ncbi:MAG: hypothetical protein AAGI24_17610 [Pseudomonadota bacterium]
MIDVVLCLGGWLVSGLSLGLLAARNSKRHRAHGIKPPPVLPYQNTLWLLALLPGLLMMLSGTFAALLVWLGGVTVLGWLLALRRPG